MLELANAAHKKNHIAGGMGQVGSRAIALGPIEQHELHSGHPKIV